MARCLTCSGTFSCPNCMPDRAFEPALSNVGAPVGPCPDKCAATIQVRDRSSRKGIDAVTVELAGASGPPKTDSNGFAHYSGLDPKDYVAKISLAGLEKRYALPQGTDGSLKKNIAAGGYEFYVFDVDPLTSLEVTVARSDRDGLGVKDAEVTLTGEGGLNETRTSTAEDGKVLFENLRVSQAKLKVTLKGDLKNRFQINDKFTEQVRADALTATRDVTLTLSEPKNEAKFVVSPLIYLTLQYEDPEKAVRFFPKDFAVKVVFSKGDATIEKDVKLLDDKGRVEFEAEKDQTHFTLKFDSDKLRMLVHADAKVEVIEDPSEPKMRELTTAGKRLFSLPKAWSLVHATWTVKNITIPKDGKVAIPAEGVGTAAAPGELTLSPKLQYVRFQFYDRKFAHDDGAASAPRPVQVHIPPVIIKAARTSDDITGDPIGPIAGTHDAISNWMIDRADNAKGCQVVPWVVTKDDAGEELPKLSNKMLLEFGWDDGFVVSNGATDRTIETIATGDNRRKPDKERYKYYDLPKLWRSKCYYTRLPGGDADPSKNKFFDQLTETDIEVSLQKTTPFVFSLDDVVLTSGSDDKAGQTAVKDQDLDGNSLDLSKHSRVAQLYLDAKDAAPFRVKIYRPRPEAAFHSLAGFVEGPSGTWRNVITEHPANVRAVVFCNGFHDVFDKRTLDADFALRQVVGARAARLNDSDVSARKQFLSSSGSDVTDNYVHRARIFDLYYLHYGASDGTRVYGALVTHWSANVFSLDADRPSTFSWTEASDPQRPLTGDIADARAYRKDGMANAMNRWNEKDYQLEPATGADDVTIKFFKLFEAKAVEDANTFVKVGGKPHALLGVGKEGTYVEGSPPEQKKFGGSVANAGNMFMRKAAFTDEPDWSADVRTGDYHGVVRKRFVLAHELGHGAIGLWDDYVTQTWVGVPSFTQKEGQRYKGIPYYRDDASMMQYNRSPRIRMYWGRANWVNDEAAAGKSLNKFLGGRQFKITWESGSGAKFNYVRPPASRSIYEPSHSATPLALENQGKVDLFLYQLGDDEFARQTKGGPYNGILVVELRLCVIFKTGVHPKALHWEEGTSYVVGDCAEHEGKFFVCTENDDNSGPGATAGSKWFELDPDAGGSYNWTFDTNCEKQEWYSSSGANYVALKDHKSGSFIAENFQARNGTATQWTEGNAYNAGDMVKGGGSTRICVNNHSADASGNSGEWKTLGSFKAFGQNVDFSDGDSTNVGGQFYVCKTAHRAGSLDADVAAKRIARCTSRKSPWSANKTEQNVWVTNANTKITEMLEGDEGKFKLTSPAGDFSNTYVRIFVQWGEKKTPTTLNPAKPLFTLNVFKGAPEKCFHPMVASSHDYVRLGQLSNVNTLSRYLFGKLSMDAATRKSQDLTSNLTKTDLAKLKEWMEAKFSGTVFTVVDIT
jgi:hypothetical protein